MTPTTAAAVTRAPMMRSSMMIDAPTMKVPMPRDVHRKRFQDLNAWTKLQPAVPQHTSPKSIPPHLAPRFLIPSGARGPTSRLFVELPAAPSGGVGVKHPENIVGLPTPSSDYTSASGQCGDIVTSKKRRGGGASDDGREYHKRRVTERRRLRDIDDGTTPQALPTNPTISARVLRPFPPCVSADDPVKGSTSKYERRICRPRSHADGPASFVSSGSTKSHPLDLDSTSKKGKHKRARRRSSPTPRKVPSPRPVLAVGKPGLT